MATRNNIIQFTSNISGAVIQLKAFGNVWSGTNTTNVTLSYKNTNSDLYIENSNAIINSTQPTYNVWQYLDYVEAQEKSGYDFVGWYTLAADQAAVTRSSPLTTPRAMYLNTLVSTERKLYRETIEQKAKRQPVNDVNGSDTYIPYELYAVYRAATPKYTITFKDHDGTVLSTQTVEQGQSATPPANPTRSGFVFTGWSGTYTNVQASAIITAQYREQGQVYTIEFRDYNGSVLKTQDVEAGQSATPPTPTRAGYTFTGWTGGSYQNVSSDAILTAVYSINRYPLRLNIQDGIDSIYYKVNGASSYTEITTSGEVQVEYGTTWYAYAVAASGRTYTQTSEDSPATGTMGVNGATFTAVADAPSLVLATFRAYFNLNTSRLFRNGKWEDGTVTGFPQSANLVSNPSSIIESVRMRVNNEISFVDLPVRVENNYIIWSAYITAGATPYFYFKLKEGYKAYALKFDSTLFNSSDEYYSYYFHEDFFSDDELRKNPVSSIQGLFKTHVIKSDRDDYRVFLTAESPTTGVANCDHGFYFFADDVETFNIDFVDYDGTLIERQTVSRGGSGTAPTSPFHNGRTFTGWSGSYTNVTSDVTITATYSANNYAVTLVKNGGIVNSYNVTSYTYGVGCQLPSDVTKNGFAFLGWFDNPEYTGERVLTIDSAQYGDKTFYAKWRGDAHQVTLVTNGGTVNAGDVSSYVAGEGAILPTDVTRNGYEFGGWYRNSSLTGGAAAYIGVEELGDKVFYAKWTPAIYDITYHANGGEISDPVNVYIYGVAIPLPSDVTRSGYHFDGWRDNSALTGDRIDTIQASDTGDREYWAKWLGIHTVTFKDHDGTVLKVENVPDGMAASAPLNPYRTGYVFNGWSASFSSVTSNLIVTATYNAQAYKVTWRDYDGTSLKEEFVEYGEDATPPEVDPSREGNYTFTGWYGVYTNVTSARDIFAQYNGAYSYRLKGRRYLRKYAAGTKSPAYAALQDAAEIVDKLCTVKWEPVSMSAYPTMPTHNEAQLDRNVENRDWFDAAEFCAEHEENGSHRSYAQAACYKFKLPDDAINKAIASIKVNVTSDPYNPYGARIAVLTSDTGEIPMDCQTVRNGELHTVPDADGVGAAPRLYSEDAKGNVTWWANTEDVRMTPPADLRLKKYLLVFVCLENYGRARNGWLEGSSYIRNDIELSVAESIGGLYENVLNECIDDSLTCAICKDGVMPEAVSSGVTVVEVQGSGDDLPVDGVPSLHTTVTDEQSCMGLRMAYAKFRSGLATELDAAVALVSNARPGAGFVVRKGTRTIGSCTFPIWRIIASSMVLPFTVPVDFKAVRIKLDWDAWSGNANGGKFLVWLKRGAMVGSASEVAKNPRFYDGSESSVDGWELLGTIDSSQAVKSQAFEIKDGLAGYFATLMMTAYVSCDAVNPDSEIDTPIGVATSMDADILTGTASGMNNGWKPDVTLIG